MNAITVSIDEIVEELVETLQVPDSKYEAANTAFRSICNWFERDESTIADTHDESYLQGSFRLGTAIRPTTEEDDYDLDIVCVLNETKSAVSQSDLKEAVGREVKSYSKRHDMKRPADARRCWTQEYADGSQFHVDILPALYDGTSQKLRLEAYRLSSEYSDDTLAITDKTNANYHSINPNWPNSNPKGYAAWFESRLGSVLRNRKAAIALQEAKNVDDIPTYRARTPLQKAVQILKYHRDVMFADDFDDKPISIIITTLAAHAYGQETTTSAALQSILDGMDRHIEQRQGIDWIVNPTNPMENFADKWIQYPKRRENFYKWLDTAREDFAALKQAHDSASQRQIISEAFGDEVEKLWDDKRLKRNVPVVKRKLLPALHREPPPWTLAQDGAVSIYKATKHERGFRAKPFSSDSTPVRKNAPLRFYAKTDIPMPYTVYWQIVNTGIEAERANCLRGGFDVGSVHSGHLAHSETTLYSGSHSVECFIVKNGYLAARSGQFIVNIQ